jgi:hypothetical protein
VTTRIVHAITVLLALACAAAASDAPPLPPVQPLLLPQAELLKALDRRLDWVMVPFADWQRMRAAGLTAGSAANAPPHGAWCESGAVAAVLHHDELLDCRGDLIAVTAASPARIQLFAARPGELGAVTVDGAPGLVVQDAGGGVDVLIATTGRHALAVTWSQRLAGADPTAAGDAAGRLRGGELALPVAAALQLSVTADTPGEFISDSLAAAPGNGDPGAAPRWISVAPAQPVLHLAWRPGAAADAAVTVFAAEQALAVVEQDGAKPFRWTARLDLRRGALANDLALTLPAGWTATVPGPGVIAITDVPGHPGSVVLRLDPAARTISLAGFAAHDAAIALPDITGAAWQPGVVTVAADTPQDCTPPPTWRAVADDSMPANGHSPASQAWRRTFAAPGPDAGMTVIPLDPGVLTTCRSAAALGLGPERWRLDQILHIRPGSTVFSVPLRLPAGWRLVAMSSDFATTVPDPGEVAPGALITLPVPAGVGRGSDLAISAAFEREAPPATAAAEAVELVEYAAAGPVANSRRIIVTAAEPIAAEVHAQGQWHLVDAPDGGMGAMDAAPVAAVPGGDVVGELFATGDPTPLLVAAHAKPAAGEAEAVVYVAPAAAATWCRIDLRLVVRDGELGDLAVDAPLVRDADLQVHAEGFSLVPATANAPATPGVLRLHAPARWRGERLLRIEGRLDPAAGACVPRIAVHALADAGSADPPTELPLRTVAAAQAPAGPDLKWTPAPGALAMGEDDLPAWSRPIPGAPVAAAWRLEGSASVGWTTVPRQPAPLPAGFIDRLEAATRIDRLGVRGGMTLLRALVAAPGRQFLALRLAAGEHLVQATIDGVPVAVAHGAADGANAAPLVLPLPGRTQIQLALLIAEDFPVDASADADADSASIALALPDFAPLQVVRCTWTLAVNGPWRVRAQGLRPGAGAPVELAPDPGFAGPERAWFHAWTLPAEGIPAGSTFTLPPLPAPAAGDPRALTATVQVPALPAEPTLALSGRTWLQWSRLDGDGVLRVQLDAVDHLRSRDAVGWIIGALLGLGLAAWTRRYVAATVGLAALGVAVALHAWSLPAGGLLALSEILAPAVLAGWLLAALLRLGRAPMAPAAARAAATALIAILVAGAGVHAEDAAPETVLMGYQRLDAAGLPQGIQVALTRAQLQALWQRSQPTSASAAPCALALGGLAIDLHLDQGHQPGVVVGELAFDCAAFGPGWQELRINGGAGRVTGISVLAPTVPLPPAVLAMGRDPAAATPPWPGLSTVSAGDGAGPTVAWRMDGDQVVLALAGGHQWRITVALALAVDPRDGGWEAALPWLPGSGGTVQLHGAAPAASTTPAAPAPTLAGMTLSLSGREAARASDPSGGLWRWDLPVTGAPVLRANPQAAGAPVAGRLELHQDIALAICSGRLEWRDDLGIASVVAPHRLVIALPAGLAVTGAEGAGLTTWQQQDATLVLTWLGSAAAPLAVHLTGAIGIAAGAGSAAVVPDLPGAVRQAGRLGLHHGDGLRFTLPDGLQRVDPAAGEDLAAAWDGLPGRSVVVAWSPDPSAPAIEEHGALIVGRDRVRVNVRIIMSGSGTLAALHLRLPGPWRLTAADHGADDAAAFSGSGDQRVIVLRPLQPFHAGTMVDLALEAERSDLGRSFAVPDLQPQAGGGEGPPTLLRQVWAVGDAGDLRLKLVSVVADGALAGQVDALAAETGAVLRPGETWRLACVRGGEAPRFELATETLQAVVTASHYLVVGAERVRWSAHLDWAVAQGALAELRCTLPAQVRLLRVHAADLGAWHLDGQTLIATLTAPTRTHAGLDLEMEAPLGDALQLAAIATAQPLVAQQVAAVAEDDIGLLHFAADGLESGAGSSALILPQGVDASLVSDRWHALRPDWRLGVTREALAATGGVDGVATLVEVTGAVSPEGELRARAVWHLLNRSRQQLPLKLPPGVALWELRLDGAAVQPSADPADPTVVWVPARTLRPGEAALRIEVTWREALGAAMKGGEFSPGFPAFQDVSVNQVLWRLAAPAPWHLEWRGGALKPVTAVAALDARAHRVIDELTRLREQDGLKEAGLRRLGDQLAALDLELADYQAGLELAGAGPQAQALGSARPPAATVQSNRDQLRDDQQRLQNQFTTRSQRRNGLGFGNMYQSWSNANNGADNLATANGNGANNPSPNQNGAPIPGNPANGITVAASSRNEAPVTGDFAAPACLRDPPWRAPLALAAGTGLGAGDAPPGWRQAAAASDIGMELVALPVDGAVLDLGGGGQELSVRLALVAPPTLWWPYAVLAISGLILVLALWAWLSQRRSA